MHNNIIYLTDTQNQKNKQSKKICNMFLLVADAFATLSIGACTIFCMYLAYTML